MNPQTHWQQCTTLIRLRPGYHLYQGSDGAWTLYTPEEQFIRLHIPAAQMDWLAPILGGVQPPQAVLAHVPEADVLSNLLDQFAQQHFLTAVDAAERENQQKQVVIYGANPVADQVVTLLQASRVDTLTLQADDVPALMPDLVIACAGWLPDTRWLALDAWCQEHRVAWHMSYIERLQAIIGPIAIPEQTARYADTRARRLAAAPFPTELIAYWRSLEPAASSPSVPWPNSGGTAMIAGALVADALAYLSGSPVPSAGYQLAFDPIRLDWQRHAVLPVPR